MSRHPELYQWIDTVVMRFPSLSKPQALGLALWSFGKKHGVKKHGVKETRGQVLHLTLTESQPERGYNTALFFS